MGKLNRLKKGSCILLVGTLISTVLPMNSVAQEPMNSDRIIVSLGDSYSSGEGIEEFFGQNKELYEKISNYDWLAHRSQNAWSGMLTLSGVSGNMSENRNRNWYFVASSGAEIKHLYEEQVKTYYKSASGEISKTTVRGAKRNYIKPYYGSVDLPEQLSIFDTLKEEGKCAAGRQGGADYRHYRRLAADSGGHSCRWPCKLFLWGRRRALRLRCDADERHSSESRLQKPFVCGGGKRRSGGFHARSGRNRNDPRPHNG